MKNIIIREYLESLTESEELDFIFPILLEVMDFTIISTPKMTKGLPQYGKDVIAIGVDEDLVKKRFYFEIKGGVDRHITTTNYKDDDGIRESIIEAKDRTYKDFSYPGFNDLPVKIVLVHNGIIRANVKETFDGFIEQMFHNKTDNNKYEFERWDIYKLTELFTEKLFNEYLMVDEEAVTNFKKVLVLIGTPRNNYTDFTNLVNSLFEKAGPADKMGERKRWLFIETINLLSFIVFAYCKEANNLEPAKKCIPYALLRLWNWIISAKLQEEPKILQLFNKQRSILVKLLEDFIQKTLAIAKQPNGLWNPRGSRYERVGYPIRALAYVSWFVLYIQMELRYNEKVNAEQLTDDLLHVIKNNDAVTRPHFDNHSIPIGLVVWLLMRQNKEADAKSYLRDVLQSIHRAYNANNRLPDAGNNFKSIIRFAATRKKSIYYNDKTSDLFGMLFEWLALLDMEEEYTQFRALVIRAKVDVALFVPFDDTQLKERLSDEQSHESHLLSHELYEEGLQEHLDLPEEFDEFRQEANYKPDFLYEYETAKSNLNWILHLAHIYYKTPLFSNTWKQFKRTHVPTAANVTETNESCR